MADTLTQDTDQDEIQRRQRAVGKIIGPPQAQTKPQPVVQPIGTPIVPKPTVTPGMAAPDIQPPVSQSLGSTGATLPQTSTMGTPISPGMQTPITGTPKPEYHGLKRVGDTILGATNIGSAIESAGGFGTRGWETKNAQEQQQSESANKSAQEQASIGQTEANTGLAATKEEAALHPPQKPDTAQGAAALAKVGMKRNEDGSIVPMTEAEMPQELKNQQDMQKAADDYKNAQTALINSKNDPNSAAYKLEVAKMEAAKEALQQRLGMEHEGLGMRREALTNQENKPNQALQAADKSAQDSLNFASDYLANGTQKDATGNPTYTGPGDEALMEQFFNLARPSTGFRMNQAQISMLMKARSWMDSAEGIAFHATNGVWFPPDQRKQIVETMQQLARSKGVGGHTGQGGGQGGAGAPNTPPPGAKVRVFNQATGKLE